MIRPGCQRGTNPVAYAVASGKRATNLSFDATPPMQHP